MDRDAERVREYIFQGMEESRSEERWGRELEVVIRSLPAECKVTGNRGCAWQASNGVLTLQAWRGRPGGTWVHFPSHSYSFEIAQAYRGSIRRECLENVDSCLLSTYCRPSMVATFSHFISQ